MNKVLIVIIALLAVSFLVPGNPADGGNSVIITDKPMNEGAVAHLLNSDVGAPQPQPDDNDNAEKSPHPDPSKCVCGGTGVIEHGDGHTTPCPYAEDHKNFRSGEVSEAVEDAVKLDEEAEDFLAHNEPQKVEVEITVKQPEVALPPPPAPTTVATPNMDTAIAEVKSTRPDMQIIMYTAEWCGPCQEFKNTELSKMKERFHCSYTDPLCKFHMVDVDTPAGKAEFNRLREKYGEDNFPGLPTFAFFDRNRKLHGTYSGFKHAEVLLKQYDNVLANFKGKTVTRSGDSSRVINSEKVVSSRVISTSYPSTSVYYTTPTTTYYSSPVTYYYPSATTWTTTTPTSTYSTVTTPQRYYRTVGQARRAARYNSWYYGVPTYYTTPTSVGVCGPGGCY